MKCTLEDTCGHIMQEMPSFKSVRGSITLTLLEMSWAAACDEQLGAEGISGSCSAFCCSVTCTAWLCHSCLMAVRCSACNYSGRASPDRLPVESWPWWRGQGLREQVLTALCRWRFYRLRRALVCRSVCCWFPCSEKEDNSGSLGLRKDFIF